MSQSYPYSHLTFLLIQTNYFLIFTCFPSCDFNSFRIDNPWIILYTPSLTVVLQNDSRTDAILICYLNSYNHLFVSVCLLPSFSPLHPSGPLTPDPPPPPLLQFQHYSFSEPFYTRPSSPVEDPGLSSGRRNGAPHFLVQPDVPDLEEPIPKDE